MISNKQKTTDTGCGK